MKLEKNFADKLLKFLTDEFNKGYNTQTQKNFIYHMEYALKKGFKTEWSLGGTYGNCYGEPTQASAEVESELTQLDDFIMSQYPHISFMQYKMIERSITKDVRPNSDYYGGETQTASKEISFSTLSDVTVKVKLEEGNNYVDSSELVAKLAQELFPVKAAKIESTETVPLAEKFKPIKKALGIADEKKIGKPKGVTEKVTKAPKKKV